MADLLNLSNEERWEKYVECTELGHDAAKMPTWSNLGMPGMRWQYCTHCGSEFATEAVQRIHERGIPDAPEEPEPLDE